MKFAAKSPDFEPTLAVLRSILAHAPKVTPKGTILRPYGVERPEGWGRLKSLLLLAAFIGFCVIYGSAYALFSPFLILQFTIPIVVLAALVIWALPDTGQAPLGLLEFLFFAYTVALTCWPNYLAISLPGLPWITMIRLIGIPMIVVLLISLSLSRQMRTSLANVLNVAPVMWKMMIGLVVIQAASIAFADEPQSSIQQFIVAQLNWTAIFFISCFVFLSHRRAELWAVVIWAAAVFVCLIGLYEYQISAVPWAGHIPSFLKVGDETVQRILAGAVRGSTGQYRVQSVFTTPLGLGEFTALALPFILHFLSGSYRFAIRAAAAATIPLIIFVVLATDSRLGLIGAIMSALTSVLLWAMLWWRRRPTSLLGPAVVLSYPAFFCAAVAATFVIGRIRERVWGSGQYADSTDARVAQVERGLPMILTHPLGHGIGMGTSTLGFTSPSGIPTIDSYYLLVGLDYGIIGFALYYGLFIYGIYMAFTHIVRTDTQDRDIAILTPLALALFNFLVIKSIFSNEENHPLAFIMLGMIMALSWRAKIAEAASRAFPSMAPGQSA